MIKRFKDLFISYRGWRFLFFILPFFVLFVSIHITPTTTTTFAQGAICPQSHPYLCDDIGPSGEEVCSAEVDCSSQNITVGSTSGPDCRQNPGYCESLSPSCPSGGGGEVTCNPNTGWCETVSCSQGLDPSSPRYQSNSNMVETRVGDGDGEDGGENSVNPNAIGGWPVEGSFSISQCPYSGGFTHGALNAVDILMPQGTPIYATFDGVITTLSVTSCNSYYNLCSDPTGYGTHIIIQGEDIWALYGHFLAGSVSHLTEGQNVEAGDYLGGMGNTGYSTGVHLHYELAHGVKFPSEQNTCL